MAVLTSSACTNEPQKPLRQDSDYCAHHDPMCYVLDIGMQYRLPHSFCSTQVSADTVPDDTCMLVSEPCCQLVGLFVLKHRIPKGSCLQHPSPQGLEGSAHAQTPAVSHHLLHQRHAPASPPQHPAAIHTAPSTQHVVAPHLTKMTQKPFTCATKVFSFLFGFASQLNYFQMILQ